MKLLIHNTKYRVQKVLHKFGWQITQYHPLQAEEDTYEIQKNLLKNTKVKTIFDVGAWIGQTAQTYKKHFPEAKIHTFEPFPESYNKIVNKVCSTNPDIIANNLAVSNKIGKATFYSNKVETTNSLLPSANTNSDHDFYRDTINQIEVDTITLNEYVSNNKINHINILKMDIQGGELKALQGATQLLSQQKIDVIYCEINFSELYKGSPFYHDLASFLSEFNYKLYNLYGLASNERGELQWGDAIFYSDTIYQRMMKK